MDALAGNVHNSGPLMNEVEDPPLTEAVLPNVIYFDGVATTVPLVTVSVPFTVTLCVSVSAIPDARLIVRLFTGVGNPEPVLCAAFAFRI